MHLLPTLSDIQHVNFLAGPDPGHPPQDRRLCSCHTLAPIHSGHKFGQSSYSCSSILIIDETHQFYVCSIN